MRRTAAGIGELLWDVFSEGRRPGGAPGNFACHIAGLGCRGVLVSRVGDDAAGRGLIARLDGLGVECSHIALDGDHPTGESTVVADARGAPAFVIQEGAAWDFIEYTPGLAGLARDLDAVCFGTLAQRSPVSRETIESFLGAMPPGALRVLDVNLRPPHFNRPVVESSLRRANVLKLNDDELTVMSQFFGLQGDAPSKLRELVARFDLRAVALTRGPAGSVLVAGRRTSVHPGCPARVVDTVGAGDAFAAVLTAGLLDGDDLDSINDRANRVAAFVCERVGATPAVPPDILGSRPG